MWNIEGRFEVYVLIQNSPVLCLAINRNDKYLISGNADNTVRLWNLDYKIQETVFEGHLDIVNHVALSYNEEFIISNSHDGTVRVWNIKEKRQEHVLRESKNHWINDYNEINFLF